MMNEKPSWLKENIECFCDGESDEVFRVDYINNTNNMAYLLTKEGYDDQGYESFYKLHRGEHFNKEYQEEANALLEKDSRNRVIRLLLPEFRDILQTAYNAGTFVGFDSKAPSFDEWFSANHDNF